MSTDLYGVRVLDLDPAERRVRFRVFSVYYAVADESIPPPDDASFFLRILWDEGDTRFGEGGPIGDAITRGQVGDPAWVDAHTRRFIDRVELLSVRNDPVPDDGGDAPQDIVHDEEGGRWIEEERLTQADYEVRVTDARWMAHLKRGQSWGTTSYPTAARGFADAALPDARWVMTAAGTADGLGDTGPVAG